MVEDHRHTGTDSARLFAKEAIRNAPQEAMTTALGSALSTGGPTGLTTADALILENMRTRINELETKLRAIGLIL
jgi:hypothetical protein